MDFMDLVSQSSSTLRSNLLRHIKDFARIHAFHRFSWISMDFTDVRGFGGSGVIKFQHPKVQPAAPLETFARIMLFIDFHGIPLDFIDFHGFRGSGVIKFQHPKVQPAAPIETFTRIHAFHRFSRFPLISQILIDFVDLVS